MKRVITIIVSITLVMCCMSSCRIEGYDSGYDDGYADGREAGFEYGYTKGIEEAQRFLAFAVDDDLIDLKLNIRKEYGLHPEDALDVLTNYIDVPDEVDEQELVDAIYAIRRYYYKSNEIINGIEYYWID